MIPHFTIEEDLAESFSSTQYAAAAEKEREGKTERSINELEEGTLCRRNLQINIESAAEGSGATSGTHK